MYIVPHLSLRARPLYNQNTNRFAVLAGVHRVCISYDRNAAYMEGYPI